MSTFPSVKTIGQCTIKNTTCSTAFTTTNLDFTSTAPDKMRLPRCFVCGPKWWKRSISVCRWWSRSKERFPIFFWLVDCLCNPRILDSCAVERQKRSGAKASKWPSEFCAKKWTMIDTTLTASRFSTPGSRSTRFFRSGWTTTPNGRQVQLMSGSKPEFGIGGFETYAQQPGTYRLAFLDQ